MAPFLWGHSPLFHNISTIFCYLMLDFHVKTGSRFSLRGKRLFEISEVEITTVNCSFGSSSFSANRSEAVPLLLVLVC